MRKSLEDIQEYVKPGCYPGIPEELKHLNYYTEDLGHVICAIPSGLLEQIDCTRYDIDLFEVALPARYVLNHPYKMFDGDHIIVQCGYDLQNGPIISPDWIVK